MNAASGNPRAPPSPTDELIRARARPSRSGATSSSRTRASSPAARSRAAPAASVTSRGPSSSAQASTVRSAVRSRAVSSAPASTASGTSPPPRHAHRKGKKSGRARPWRTTVSPGMVCAWLGQSRPVPRLTGSKTVYRDHSLGSGASSYTTLVRTFFIRSRYRSRFASWPLSACAPLSSSLSMRAISSGRSMTRECPASAMRRTRGGRPAASCHSAAVPSSVSGSAEPRNSARGKPSGSPAGSYRYPVSSRASCRTRPVK